MDNTNPGDKYEIIEQALQEAVGGGMVPVDLCGLSCHIFSINVCDFSCSIGR